MHEQNVFQVRTVEEINNGRYTFHVPDYQRGYRWKKEQVTKLLEDLAQWDSPEPYSLQPVIVHQKDQDGSLLDVVDGQQRLTTIALILGSEAKYSLQYETRTETSKFLEDLKTGTDRYKTHKIEDLFGQQGTLRKIDPENHTIDNFHLLSAFRTISEWKKESGNRGRFEKATKTLLHAELLWYQITENPRVVFARINSGKIQLSDADLIKATLLKDEGEQRSLISRQWNEIEQQLADDSFWAFLGENLSQKYNRIELLFRIVVPSYDERSDGTHALYNKCVAKYLEAGEATAFLNLWYDVWTLFETLLEWYEANPMYHRIGYLARWNTKKGKKEFNIGEAYKKYLDLTKREFAHWLDTEIVRVMPLTLKNKTKVPFTDARELTETVAYGDTSNRDIEKVLLLFNLPIEPEDWPPQEEQSNEGIRYRYPFDLHLQEKWSVEHIHAQSAKKPDTAKEVDTYLSGIEKMLDETPKIDAVLGGTEQNLLKAAKDLIRERQNGAGIDQLRARINDMHGQIEEAMSARKDSLDNLALLSGTLNTSIGNGFFSEKRRKIIEQDRAGKFIPRETRNVFLKYYSENLSGALWDTRDREHYIDKIQEKLQPWFDVRKDG